MIHATVSQGADDIRAVLDWLDLNPTLKPSTVVLVTFSLVGPGSPGRPAPGGLIGPRSAAWISCMGTMEFRELMSRVNCGLDLLEQYQLGIDLGVIPILGNLISMVPYASDVVANRVATLEQAREDMAHIDLPITWIYGEHDHWVKAEFVRDIMSVQVDAPREVVSVPLGHNARTSEEALQLFGTITDQIHRFLYRDSLRPVPPDKANMEIIRRAEKDRLPARRIKDRKAYWQRYLVGEDRLLGFDCHGPVGRLPAADGGPAPGPRSCGPATACSTWAAARATSSSTSSIRTASARPADRRRPHPQGHGPGLPQAPDPLPRAGRATDASACWPWTPSSTASCRCAASWTARSAASEPWPRRGSRTCPWPRPSGSTRPTRSALQASCAARPSPRPPTAG